jgi:hypothetical protein
MYTEQERIDGIASSEETGEKKIVDYRGDRAPRVVKRIPLEYLLYNPHNGRIRSYTKSYESNSGELDPSRPEDKLIIEQYLYDSARNRNERTLESLQQNGQQESGIVTKDGVIIDGNRRAMLLSILSKKQNAPGFFNAVILPDKLRDSEKDIITLETNFQMGVDSKVDYNPIEKYIRCKELHDKHALSIAAIATLLSETEPQIVEWLNILGLMDEYLSLFGSPELYTRIEKKEGHFVDLNTYLNSYARKGRSSAKWDFTEKDINDLKVAYYRYIRLGIPVLRARVIAKPSGSNSFFCHKDIWDEFKKDLEAIVVKYQQPSFTDLRQQEPQKSNEDVVRYLDNAWREKLGEQLQDLLNYNEALLRDKLEKYAPIKILRRVINSLGQIDENNLVEASAEARPLLGTIKKKVNHLETLIS